MNMLMLFGLGGNERFTVHNSPLKYVQLIISQLKHVCTSVLLALVFIDIKCFNDSLHPSTKTSEIHLTVLE